MKIVFCCDSFSPKNVDEAYLAEATAATEVGFEYLLVDYEALVNDAQPDRSVRRVPEQSAATLAMYRGWMLKPAQYALLHEALAKRGVHLINDIDAYRHCHYLPESYSIIEEITPKSVWMTLGDGLNMDVVMQLLRPFGAGPVVVKDFVKSCKHNWEEACFIQSASDQAAVERVVRRFIELQDDDLNEGLVFREFVEFEPLTEHSKSGMPLTLEYRIFFLDGSPVFSTEYWDEGKYEDARPPIEQFQRIAENVESRFFTMDVAKRKDGSWMIVELGDGQVAGLAEHVKSSEFYSRVWRWNTMKNKS